MARAVVTKTNLRRTSKSIGIEGLDETLQNIANVLDKTSAEQLKGVYLKAGQVLRDRAKQNAPYRTGTLQGAIFAARGKPEKSNVLVGVNRKKAPHGILLEYGTSRMRPRPFFRPAITETRPQMTEIIVNGFMEAVEKGAES